MRGPRPHEARVVAALGVKGSRLVSLGSMRHRPVSIFFACRDRLLASLSNYKLGRRFWHQQDYQRSLEAVEQSIAVKLFPYKVRERACVHALLRTVVVRWPPFLSGKIYLCRPFGLLLPPKDPA